MMMSNYEPSAVYLFREGNGSGLFFFKEAIM